MNPILRTACALLAWAVLCPPSLAQLTPPASGPVDQTAKPSAAELFAKQMKPADAAKFSTIPDAEIAKLDAMVQSGDYFDIGRYATLHSGDAKLVAWLTSKAQGGSVPAMWMLAEDAAGRNSIELAVKWSYAALLGTMQERALCLDNAVDYAAGQIADSHPHLVRLTRQNPFELKDSKIFAIGVLRSATAYPDPTPWLCKPYGNPDRAKRLVQQPYAYDPIYFPVLRARARNKLLDSMQIPVAPETPPAMPAPLSKPGSARPAP